MGIRSWLYNRKLKTLKHQPLKSGVNRGDTMIIIVDTSIADSESAVNSFLDYHKKSGKRCFVVEFVNDENSKDERPDYILCITDKDFNWYGYPKNHEIIDFISRPFDLAICINPNGIDSLNFVIEASNARLKIGLGEEQVHFYDLIIAHSEVSNYKSVFNQINNTLSILSK